MTVSILSIPDKLDFSNYDGVYVCETPFEVTISVDKKKVYTFSIDIGFKTDGLSVPRIFRWFLPSWDKDNVLYNISGILHDGLYGNAGFGIFSREECDDVLRGLLRDSGISRFKASTADWCLEKFAKSHWNNDDKRCKDKIRIEEVK